MKLLQLNELQQSYSLMQADKPTAVWGLAYVSEFSVNGYGIPVAIVESMAKVAEGWTGWGFGQQNSWLLFEKQEDAIMANVTFGETYGNN